MNTQNHEISAVAVNCQRNTVEAISVPVKYLFAPEAVCRRAACCLLKFSRFRFEEVKQMSRKQDALCPSSRVHLGSVTAKDGACRSSAAAAGTAPATLWRGL